MRFLIRLATIIALFAWTGFATAEQVTIRMWMHEHPPRIPIDKSIIADFEKANPDVKVQYDVISGLEYSTKLLTAFAAGSGPDLFNNTSTLVTQYFAARILAPIDYDALGYANEAALLGKFQGGFDGIRFQGKLYGVPTEVSNWACFANNALWKEAGLDPAKDWPKTWEGLPAVAEKLTKRDQNGVPMRRGRMFDARDRAGAPAVVVINETMAQRYWPNQNPIGRRLTHDLSIVPGQATTREVIGVVADIRHFGLEQAAEPQMFVPHAQMPWPSMAIVIRSPLDASRLSAAVRQAVWSADDTIPVPVLRSMDQALADAVGQPRFRAWLLGLFAATAVVLAATGLYGTMACAAQQRTREIGLRIALGATPHQATAMLVRRGMTLAVIGIVAGLTGSVGVARALSTMLFGVGMNDPATFIGVPLLFALVAAVACYVPAWHARRLDPIAAINADV